MKGIITYTNYSVLIGLVDEAAAKLASSQYGMQYTLDEASKTTIRDLHNRRIENAHPMLVWFDHKGDLHITKFWESISEDECKLFKDSLGVDGLFGAYEIYTEGNTFSAVPHVIEDLEFDHRFVNLCA